MTSMLSMRRCRGRFRKAPCSAMISGKGYFRARVFPRISSGLVEEFPSRYSVSAARQHRWVRGDWAPVVTLDFRVPGVKRRTVQRPTAIPLMGRWKLLDNLRRSLSARFGTLSLLIAWMLPLAVAEIWTTFILLTIALPPFLPALVSFIPRRAGVTVRNHLRAMRSEFAASPFCRALF